MAEDAETKTKKGGAKMLVVGAALALAFGGGGFYTVYSGLVALPLPPANTPESEAAATAAEEVVALPRTAFSALEPIQVSLGAGTTIKQLQMVAELEVDPAAAEALTLLHPRVRDVMTTYLRAIDPSDVEDPAALLRLRAQMLRRIQVVTGEGMVRDLLVSEFILR